MTRSKGTNRRFLVSDECFELMTEAMRLKSNSIKKFASLRDVVEDSITKLSAPMFDDLDFHLFISTKTIAGGSPVYLTLSSRINMERTALQAKLQEVCGIEVYDRTAIAYFLQLYIDKQLY